MNTVETILTIVVSMNTVVIAALTYLYLKQKDSNLEDE
jgi:hypothetical protein